MVDKPPYDYGDIEGGDARHAAPQSSGANLMSARADQAAIATGPAPSEPWETLEEEQAAANFGMWLFLVTEILFFGGMFLAYAVNRVNNPEGFLAGARATEITLGTINIVILLVSSVTMIVAVQGAQAGLRGLVWKCLAVTAALGVAVPGRQGLRICGRHRAGSRSRPAFFDRGQEVRRRSGASTG